MCSAAYTIGMLFEFIVEVKYLALTCLRREIQTRLAFLPYVVLQLPGTRKAGPEKPNVTGLTPRAGNTRNPDAQNRIETVAFTASVTRVVTRVMSCNALEKRAKQLWQNSCAESACVVQLRLCYSRLCMDTELSVVKGVGRR